MSDVHGGETEKYDVDNKVQYVMTAFLTWGIQQLCQESGVSDEGGRLEIVPEYRVTNIPDYAMRGLCVHDAGQVNV